jgi:hypothetical protein
VSTHPARRLWAALETLHDVTYFAAEVRAAGIAQGLKGFWMTYFAWRAAPLGPGPAAPVVAMFAGFHPGTVARALPEAWSRTTPQSCIEARTAVSAAALRAAGADPGACGRAAELLAPVAAAADPTGRPLGAANAALELPAGPLARLWQLATTLREHRGDGHVAALVGARIGGTEAHVLSALEMGIHPPESFGRIHHLPKERLAAVMDGLRERGLVDTESRFTEAGRETKRRIEALTDELASPPYEALSPAELDELMTELEPITASLVAAGSQ